MKSIIDVDRYKDNELNKKVDKAKKYYMLYL